LPQEIKVPRKQHIAAITSQNNEKVAYQGDSERTFDDERFYEDEAFECLDKGNH
jgi:hypothetical protein